MDNGLRSKKRKYLKRVLAVTILAAAIIGVNYMAALSFDKPHDADYYNYDVRHLQETKTPVDMIIVGASQVYLGCNVDVISGEMSIGEVIDCAAPVGFVDGLYYMLRDLLRRFDPKCVVIDMSWRKFLRIDDLGSRFGMYLCSDRLEWPDKIDFALHCYTLDDWPNFIPVYRNGKNVWGLSQVKRNFQNKIAIAQNRFAIDDRYRRNGFIWAVRSCPQGSIPAQEKHYSRDQISEYYQNYIRKTWELCDERDIPVVWTTIPCSMEEMLSVDNYQEAVDDIAEFVDGLGGEYLNFSYLKDREELFPDPLFADKLHLNGEGSIVFGKIFADAVQKALNGEDTSDLFYENMDELKKDVHRIVACNGRVRPNGDGTMTVEVKSLQGTDETPEFRLMLIERARTIAVKGDEEDAQRAEDAGSEEEDYDGGDRNEADAEVAADAGSQGETEDDSDDGVQNQDASAESDQEKNAENSEDESLDIRELRSWQEETTFQINEDEIPEGYVLRVEARRKGEAQTDAAVNRLTGEYQANRVIWG